MLESKGVLSPYLPSPPAHPPRPPPPPPPPPQSAVDRADLLRPSRPMETPAPLPNSHESERGRDSGHALFLLFLSVLGVLSSLLSHHSPKWSGQSGTTDSIHEGSFFGRVDNIQLGILHKSLSHELGGWGGGLMDTVWREQEQRNGLACRPVCFIKRSQGRAFVKAMKGNRQSLRSV